MIKKGFFKKYFLSILVLIVMSFFLQIVLYGFDFKLKNISDSIFAINIIVFVIALIMQTGASRIFMSINYTFKTWFKYKQTKEKYDNFQEYYETHEKEHKKNIMHLIYATLTLILIAILLGIIYLIN